jgi:hypothetical protein
MHMPVLFNMQEIRHQKADICYSHIPKAVCEHEDQGAGTGREVLANRQNITIKNKTEKICLLINIDQIGM